MPKVDLITTTGQKSGKIDLPKEIFAAVVNPALMAQAVRVYLSRQRCAHAKAKTRGAVSGSGRKIWRQKGTGRARHGDRYAPIFVGGGKAHGPAGKANYQLEMSRKMRRLALFSALTSKFKDNEVLVVKGLSRLEPKTKVAQLALTKITGHDKVAGSKAKLTIILPEIMENLDRAARNLQGIRLAQASLLNPYEVLNGGRLILMEESIAVMEEKFLGKTKKEDKAAKEDKD